MIELISILWRWKKFLAATLIASIIGGIALAYLLPVYYNSVASFLIANPALYDRSALFQEKPEKPIYPFGGKEDINRVISIANSQALLGKVVEKFDLFDVYNLDTDDPESAFYVIEELLDNFSIKKNSLGTVELEVLDKDPERAAEMANFILDELDKDYTAIVFSKQQDFSSILQNEVKSQSSIVDGLMDSLYTTIQKNPEDTVTIGLVTDVVERSVEELASAKSILNQFSTVLNQKSSLFFVQGRAEPAVKKAKPIRWIVLLTTVLGVMSVAAIGVIVLERTREFNQERA